VTIRLPLTALVGAQPEAVGEQEQGAVADAAARRGEQPAKLV
jgi:hypothetical protein